MLLRPAGVLRGFTLTGAQCSKIHRFGIGDKGYLSGPLQQARQQMGLELETALPSNLREARDPVWVKLLKRRRRRIETAMGQLVEDSTLKRFGGETWGT